MRLALALASAFLVAACATTRLEPPAVAVSRVTIDGFAGASAQFTIVLALSNPNDREIAVEAIAAELRMEDVVVATVRLAEPVTLPARGETTARLAGRTDLASSLQAAAQLVRRLDGKADGRPAVRYNVNGTATLAGGRVIPFSRSGEFAFRGNP